MDESCLWSFRTEPSDVDTQAVIGRSAGGQFQGMELTTRFFHLGAKVKPGYFVVLREVSVFRVDYFLLP